MGDSAEVCILQSDPSRNDLNILDELNSRDISPVKQSLKMDNVTDSSDDDDEALMIKVRKRVQQFSDSDTEKENHTRDNDLSPLKSSSGSDAERGKSYQNVVRPFKSRIQKEKNSSDSDIPKEHETVKNKEQQVRMKNKRNILQQKFKGLLSSRSKPLVTESSVQSDKQSSDDDIKESSNSEASDNEISSISKIKQKIKKSISKITSICDPDTSDDESNTRHEPAPKQKQRKLQKSTKMIEAKPIRMSAKQAMENMQMIKSESNRMLREKSVSLPYHRPKALSLKDIMARRKPAITSDGKALPIKMNEEQLKQYALQLEERQKEMMELCKSESDEETAEPELDKDTEKQTMSNEAENKETIQTDIQQVNSTEENDINTENTNDENYLTEHIITTSLQNDTDKIEAPETDSNMDDKIIGNESINSETKQNDSNTDMKLVYNDDSIEDENGVLDKSDEIVKEAEVTTDNTEARENENNNSKGKENEPANNTEIEVNGQEQILKKCTEQDSQIISLHYTETNTEENQLTKDDSAKLTEQNECIAQTEAFEQNDFFSDDDVDMEDIDKIIKNAEIMKDDNENINSPMLIKDTTNIKPKLIGAPGMVIDLDGTDPIMPKRSGVELLKERFNYFSKLKTPEELERAREKKIKPGAQHLKLKQELGDKIAEQRSLEWAKRLEEKNQQEEEIDALLDDGNGSDDSIEKIKAKIDDEEEKEASSSESEEELVEDDIEIKDKPRKHNPMVDDEAEESDIDEHEAEVGDNDKEGNEDIEEDDDNVDEENEESSDDSSSESEEEVDQNSKPKKGRILKAFEDSDEEDATNVQTETIEDGLKNQIEIVNESGNEINDVDLIVSSCDCQGSSQDDVIQLAQRPKSVSTDLFTSQEQCTPNESIKDGNVASDEVLPTQTFSISSANPADFLYPSQPYYDPNLKNITNGLSQKVLSSDQCTQSSQSQPIGEDILALCTGKFYDNEFISQTEVNVPDMVSQDTYIDDNINNEIEKQTSVVNGDLSDVDITRKENNIPVSDTTMAEDTIKDNVSDKKNDGNLLKSILDELDDPEFDNPKPNKFFTGASQSKKITDESIQTKKRLIIDSDDEANETDAALDGVKKNKKLKKKKLEKRALQISDDEDEENYDEVEDDYGSDLEEEGDRVVEYDSEENEIEVKQDKPKKKRKGTDFFENEAELTSEDEWVGSGDEDEHGLDRMEREEGDDDVFHQGQLRKELGQIHMRDVLDQDKREVRLLQELLFEDGDLGGGHRQRKFRWRNAGEEETGTTPDGLTDTQEEEFESEEQWRKQRHEREVFLRQMQNEGKEEDSPNVTINRTSIIKANLSSKSMSMLLMEANQTKSETTLCPEPEKKTAKDIPSPKKSFSILQQSYHGSLLTRGRGALARLAALATPLAADDDAPNIGSVATHKRNFVFAALTPDEGPPKVTIKRKADVGTPKLVKKMRIEEKQNHPKSSLLDHINR